MAKTIDWLLRHSDHYPQLIGTLDGAASVTIQVWDVTDGQNVSMSISNSGCYAIGDTNRWGWSTVNLPATQDYAKHYFYLMTSNIGDTFGGQVIMNAPENAKWIHPGNRNSYIV